MSTENKQLINDVALLTYKGHTQVLIAMELNLPIEQVRGIQKYLADGGEFIRTINGNRSTLNNIKKLETKLFNTIDEFQKQGGTNLVLLQNINNLKYQYANICA